MPRRKAFDKKTATTFALVHRAQNDPLIHDENAPSMVFAEKQTRRPNEDDYAGSSAGSQYSGVSYRSHKVKQRGDLEDEFGSAVRQNEGEAAQHGVFYDDTRYDYMQHMKDLGTGEGPVMWVEANAPTQKGKGKQKLEDVLRDMDLSETRSVGMSSTTSSVARSLLPEEVLPSEFVQRRSYQDQQDVPDEIAGFQPDMDPRLREVLEALEDEEYVDDEEDIFAELTKDGYEVEKDEWDLYGEQQLFEEDDAGWESDDTIKAPGSPPPSNVSLADLNLPEGEDAKPPEDVQAQPPADPTAGAWLEEFEKFKAADKAGHAKPAKLNPMAPSTLESSVLSSLASGRRKKRKGAKTSTTNYSMTSSALARTGQLTLLDDRFDKFENAYSMAEFPEEEEDEFLADNASAMSGMTGLSKASKASRYSTASGMSGVSGVSSYSRATDSEAPQLTRSDFDGIMDDFLGSHSKTGKLGRRVKRGGPQSGMEQLNEIRSQLGPARMKTGAKSAAAK
ncbi:unnamed protein product [Zymoseptoria tritici ST99CH_3D1]|nr:unnamed protein product [Zymoseptoria tritici ST99CH_3D1]